MPSRIGRLVLCSFLFPPQAPDAPRRMQVVSEGGKPLIFEEVQPVSLKAEDLAAYAGTYSSAELDTVWSLTVDGGRLLLHPKRGPKAPLEPSFTDAFDGPGGMIRFQRNGEKKVSGLLVGAGRARDLKFAKVD